MTDLEPELSLEAAIMQAIQASLREAWTAIPGRITQWDSVRQLASVEPGVSGIQTVVGVRVVQPAANVGVYLPVEEGVQGLLICCTLDASAWLLRGAQGAPASSRTHQLSYAVFLPGVGASIPAAPSKPTIGNLGIGHTSHPIAKGDAVQAWFDALSNVISAAAAGSPAGWAAFQTAWAGAVEALSIASPIESGDAEVTDAPL